MTFRIALGAAKPAFICAWTVTIYAGHAAIPGVIIMTERGRHFEDALNLLCGKELGSGIHRTVFECRIDPTLVVKVEKDEPWRAFANFREHQIWSDNQYYRPVASWLAPCRYLSPDGYISLQQRARPVIEGDTLPDKLPKFLTDIKRENFGWIDGRLVCVDYAAIVANTPSTRLRSVTWA